MTASSVPRQRHLEVGENARERQPKVSLQMLHFLNSLRIKTLGTIMAGALLVVAVGVVAVSLTTYKHVGHLGETWEEFEQGAASKTDILNNLRSAMGYGGVVHQFKNYVLRKDRPRIVKVQTKLRDVQVALTAYQSRGVSEVEKGALKTIARIMTEYAEALTMVERMASQGASSAEIDGAIKISDAPALKALV